MDSILTAGKLYINPTAFGSTKLLSMQTEMFGIRRDVVFIGNRIGETYMQLTKKYLSCHHGISYGAAVVPPRSRAHLTPPLKSLNHCTTYLQADPSLFVHPEPICERTICDPTDSNPANCPDNHAPYRPIDFQEGAAPVATHPLSRI